MRAAMARVKRSLCGGPTYDPFPLPPERLRVRIGSWPEVDHFLGVGRKISWDLDRTLRETLGTRLADYEHVLDFGCGVGRVARHVAARPSIDLHGSDIDEEAIAWCQANLPGDFVVGDEAPPTGYADDTFDLIYAISVFTHMPEQLQFDWLTELARILRPGGILVASTHSEAWPSSGDPGVDADVVETLDEHGFAYTTYGFTDGLPDWYRSTFHTEHYIRERWQDHLDIVDWRFRYINNHHDAVVALKPS